MDAPLVSVVTCFYNRRELVSASIESLLGQTYQNLEIIALDDGSTDGTFEALSRYTDSRLIVRRHDNKGFTRSMIDAVGMATAPLIAVHDAGDISLPARIARQVDVMTSMPDVGICGCLVENPILGTSRSKIVGRSNGQPFRRTLLSTNLFTHGEVMFRREVYDRAGGYRAYFRFAQDLDLWLRMSAFTDYHTVQEVLYRRLEIPGSVSADATKNARQQRFAELARQCAEAVDAGLPDLLDVHGESALDSLKPSRRLAEKLVARALRFAVRSNDFGGSALLAREAIAEKVTLKTALASVLMLGALLPARPATVRS